MKPESLTKHRATGVDDPLFLDSLDIYRTSFPVHEQRRVQDFPLAFQDPGFCYEVFLNGAGRVVAMLVSWQREAFVYLEYFAVDASLRGQGAGQSEGEKERARSARDGQGKQQAGAQAEGRPGNRTLQHPHHPHQKGEQTGEPWDQPGQHHGL